MFAALLFEYLYQRDVQNTEVRAGLAGAIKRASHALLAVGPDVAWLGLIPLALALHFGYMKWKFGNFWIFLQTEKDWGRAMVGEHGRWASFAHFSGGDLVIAILALALIALAWKRMRPSYCIYATLAFLMPLASGTLLGMGRFCAIIFPIYIGMALLGKNPVFERNWLIASSSMAVLMMAMFSQWRYVG
jgi:hypothetical protein